ncbi:MAG: bifunctional glutamate N-acetyltransferase/amino-acid acetyltransferase ArgJ [Candidatus Hydrogenedentes bacterium]|nr:bifunctional glutamate N-acetyltransferase/amino-acid acetyltransferase ArgJ [Candidatus Hydrogenedentota bacterium]
MNAVDGGVTAPAGFRASGVRAGIKPSSKKEDCALIVSDAPAAVAGVFTRNLMRSACVEWDIERCRAGHARAYFINSGNANAATGAPGAADVRATAGMVAEGLGLAADEVCISSTGVIGVPLPMDRIAEGVKGCIAALPDADAADDARASGGADAARAIMTTDTVPKEMAVEVALSAGTVRIGAIAKGAGMIAPNMATMICAITTDAAVEPKPLADLVYRAATVSFNQMCVDNDTSTSDTVLCLANGRAGVGPLEPGSADFEAFAEAFIAVCRETAKNLVRDGEGASKFVEIVVSGAASDGDAKTVARAVAVSQLCKTAFFGEDPNWGRFACAAGYAGVAFEPGRLAMWIDEVQLMAGGQAAEYREEDAAAVMQRPEFQLRIEIGDGPGRAEFWTSDLSHEYVTINADYRT